ncbi:MAG: hypothetical protein L3K13_07685 [Thermoplasmata archaeon]|nr:hypothetical protein [Thermoplasmata archaeon]
MTVTFEPSGISDSNFSTAAGSGLGIFIAGIRLGTMGWLINPMAELPPDDAFF